MQAGILRSMDTKMIGDRPHTLSGSRYQLKNNRLRECSALVSIRFFDAPYVMKTIKRLSNDFVIAIGLSLYCSAAALPFNAHRVSDVISSSM